MLIRPATSDDHPFLQRMWHMACFWQPERPSIPLEQALDVPEIARYITGFGRPTDAGLVAEIDGAPSGAAWFRLFSPDDPGYGFVDADTPELAIAVEPQARRLGVATALLEAIVAVAFERGHEAISLSVNAENPSRRIYQRCGFVDVSEEDGAFTMVRRAPRQDSL